MVSNCGAAENSWESLVLQGDKTVNPKGNQPWIFIGRTDAEAEVPILAIWREEIILWKRMKWWGKLKTEKRAVEDEMVI